MKKLLIILVLIAKFLIPDVALCQEAYDNTWVLGNKKQDKYVEKFRLFTFTFNDYKLSIDIVDSTKRGGIYEECSTSLSDTEGNLLFSTNGLRIVDNNFNILPNGDSLNYGKYWEYNKNLGYHRGRGIRAVPYPGYEDNLALIIHQRQQFDGSLGIFGDFFCDSFYLTTVKIENGKAINVVSKNKTFDTGFFDNFDMTKHANGRDWWVVYPDRLSNTINRTLISKYGTTQYGKQSFPDEYFYTSGFHLFSPNGKKYITVDDCYRIVVYDFDRCVGDLYNPKTLDIDTTIYGWTSISPNGRFLYLSSFTTLSQIDLEAPDLHLDTIAKVDFFVGVDTFYNNLTFYFSQLARDKKIYIASAGSVHYMHVIHDPNKKGKDCKLEQHGIVLPAYNYGSVNHMPNLRLGPIDGGQCDTLGLDNIPLAAFRYEKDSQDLKKLEFIDLTDYEPTDWYWTFGDGGTSTDQNPEYTYKLDGNYQVCLYASNVNGGSTYCRNISVGTTQNQEPWEQYNVKSYPNPFDDFMIINLEESINGIVDISLTNMMGEEVYRKKDSFSNGFTTIFTSNVPNGLYVLTLKQKDLGIWRSKVLKVTE